MPGTAHGEDREFLVVHVHPHVDLFLLYDLLVLRLGACAMEYTRQGGLERKDASIERYVLPLEEL